MINFRLASKSDLPSLLNLLNETTKHLHGQGIQQWEYPWESEEIRADIEKERIYILENQRVEGTFGLKPKQTIGERILEPESRYLYQIAIHPDFQGQGIGKMLLDFAKSISPIIYLDCWSKNEKLKSFYRENGFVYLEDVPEEDFLVSVFRWIRNPH